MNLDSIFFDVGSTLVFAEPSLVRGPLLERGIVPSHEQLCIAESAARRTIDAVLLAHSAPVDGTYWNAYYTRLLKELGIVDPELVAGLIGRARESSNWCRIKPGTIKILENLAPRYRLAIISNSDGRVASLLDKIGIRQFFKTVTDSGSVGFEKPDARIFRAALSSLNAAPERSLYVGDIYSVDYLGATNVGMNAVLMDSFGVYRDSGLPRVESLPELLTFIDL